MSISSRSENEREFRIAAAENNTERMLALYRHGVDINAVADNQASSRQTAAHRAAAAGHLEALRLLFNLGADFSRTDKDNKTPSQLVASNDHKTKRFFRLIADAEKALQARKLFFPKTVTDLLSDEEQRAHSENHAKLVDAIQTVSSADTALYQSYKDEAANNHGVKDSDAKQFIEDFERCRSYIRQLEAKKFIIDNAIRMEKLYCSCGEAATISFAALAGRDRVTYPVEELNILSKMVDGAGHACVVIGRDVSLEVSNLASLRDALILDPLKGRVFFYQFVNECKENTACKVLEDFNLRVGVSNQHPKFPDLLTFPRTKMLYYQLISDLLTDCATALCDRSAPTVARRLIKR